MTVDRFAGVRLLAVGGEGSKDVVVDGAGHVSTGLADGRIVRIVAAGDRVATMPVAGQAAGDVP